MASALNLASADLAKLVPDSVSPVAAVAGGTSVDIAAWMLKRAFHFVATVTRIILTPPLAED